MPPRAAGILLACVDGSPTSPTPVERPVGLASEITTYVGLPGTLPGRRIVPPPFPFYGILVHPFICYIVRPPACFEG